MEIGELRYHHNSIYEMVIFIDLKSVVADNDGFDAAILSIKLVLFSFIFSSNDGDADDACGALL